MNVIDNEPKYALTTNIKTSKSDSFQATKNIDKRRPRATFICMQYAKTILKMGIWITVSSRLMSIQRTGMSCSISSVMLLF
jgi:hypothetical protein